jgi:diguanylate cyclase (GGDEF)-like protein
MAGERILIVDDEESIRRLLHRLCLREGYDVTLASTSQEALQILEQGPIDVGVFDLFLPDGHGLDILRRAKDLYPSSEVIILTGHGDLQSAIEAMRLGAYDYLQKPVPSLQIIALTISRALERQKLSLRNDQLVAELTEANEELERRRRQQISYIRNIGQALTGSLRAPDVAQVLLRALLGSMDFQAAGVLLLPRERNSQPLAFVGAQRVIPEEQQRELACAMIQQLPENLRPSLYDTQIGFWSVSSAETQGLGDQAPRFAILSVRDQPSGVIAIVPTADAYDQEIAGILSILVSQASIALENAYLFGRMSELATQDRLTGVYNHGHFFELLEAEISRAERHAQELAVIMLDLDRQTGLKRINDTYGHQAGDMLLQEFAQLLKNSVRRADVVARYGGDEFIILAPQTGRQQAMALAQRIRDEIRETPIVISEEIVADVTVSVGVGVFHPGSQDTASSVVNMADKGTYLAKEQGGDQVCIVG